MEKRTKKLTTDQKIDRLQKTVNDLAGTMADGFYNVKLEFKSVDKRFEQVDKRLSSITDTLERHTGMLIDLNQEKVFSESRFKRIEINLEKLKSSR